MKEHFKPIPYETAKLNFIFVKKKLKSKFSNLYINFCKIKLWNKDYDRENPVTRK